MTEDLLRRWIRGELPPGQRRDVTRWIVRCTDPDLGPLMHGLALERQQEQRDALLAARGGVWERLLDQWNALLDAGRAHLSIGDDPRLVLAGAEAPEVAATSLAIVVDEGGARATFDLRPTPTPPLEAALYLTDDDGRVIRLMPAALLSGPVEVPIPGDAGSRATVWAVCALALPRDVDVVVEFDRALVVPDAKVWAARLVPR